MSDAKSRVHVSLSDLFFNYRHDTYDELWAEWDGIVSQEPTTADIRAAMFDSAVEFIRDYSDIIPTLDDISPDDLADDYMSRL